MKRNHILLIIIVVLAVVAAFLALRQSRATFRGEISDFAVSDTSNITRIFMADKSNRSVLLGRTPAGYWRVNGKYRAQQESIDLLLKTMLNLAVYEPVPEKAHNNVVAILATSSVKVEIYQEVYRIRLSKRIRLFPHEKLTKTYYVGHVTQNNIGTYMLMENSSIPFIVYIPGFRGFVASRYRTIEKDWRDHTVFASRLNDIVSITLEFPGFPQESFTVTNREDRYFTLKALHLEHEITGFDTTRVLDFVTSFGNIRYEALIDEMFPARRDSIINSAPMHIITLERKNGEVNSVKTFHKPARPGEINYKGEPVLYDRDRFYALINNGEDLVLMQHYIFDKVTKPLSWFLKP